MSSPSVTAQCPHCGSHSQQAFLPALPKVAVFDPDSQLPEVRESGHTEQRLICSACEQTWEAAIVPKSQMAKLLAAVASLDDTRRQIAMMRLIMSKDQLERAERSNTDIIKIRKAA